MSEMRGGFLRDDDGALVVAGPRELTIHRYAGPNLATVSGSSAYADAAGVVTDEVTVGKRSLLVEAWYEITPTTDTAGGGAKWRLMRTDTNGVLAMSDANSSLASGPLSLVPLRCQLDVVASPARVYEVAEGTELAFKIAIGGRTSGVATFPAQADYPICIRVAEVG